MISTIQRSPRSPRPTMSARRPLASGTSGTPAKPVRAAGGRRRAGSPAPPPTGARRPGGRGRVRQGARSWFVMLPPRAGEIPERGGHGADSACPAAVSYHFAWLSVHLTLPLAALEHEMPAHVFKTFSPGQASRPRTGRARADRGAGDGPGGGEAHHTRRAAEAASGARASARSRRRSCAARSTRKPRLCDHRRPRASLGPHRPGPRAEGDPVRRQHESERLQRVRARPAGLRQAHGGEGHLEKKAAAEPTPSDWAYVNNFEDPNRPRALELPVGCAAGSPRAWSTPSTSYATRCPPCSRARSTRRAAAPSTRRTAPVRRRRSKH